MMERELLKEYNKKRKFDTTSEPEGNVKSSGKNIFVVQKHDASRLHYDFRMEIGGVLKSWAVPKGPSLDYKVKRLAVMTEDHPLDYADFEGVIPEGEYGAGPVIVWDNGTYEGDMDLAKGHVDFVLKGKKLKGEWSLVQLKGGKNWLLIKKKDKEASDKDVLISKPDSVLTKRSIEEIAKS